MENSGGIQASLAGRYATALFELARDEKQLEAVGASLSTVRAALRESDDFRALTTSPLISRDQAVKAVAATAEVMRVDPITSNFLGVLAQNRRLSQLDQVIRAFKDENVVHVDGKVSPKDDIETINTELILADLQTIEKVLPRLQKESRIKKDIAPKVKAVEEAKEILEKGDTLFSAGIVQGSGDEELLHDLHLLTTKPFLYVFNVDEDELTDEDFKNEQRALVAPAEAIFLNAKLEADLVELGEDEALELLQSVGQEEPGLATLAHVGFRTLGLQTYLTAGPKESRAWTIKKGATAPEAAGVIHTDFQKGFIKAEVISFDDLVETGSVAEARAKGKARMEGKEYVMQDGDVVEFRFNV